MKNTKLQSEEKAKERERERERFRERETRSDDCNVNYNVDCNAKYGCHQINVLRENKEAQICRERHYSSKSIVVVIHFTSVIPLSSVN